MNRGAATRWLALPLGVAWALQGAEVSVSLPSGHEIRAEVARTAAEREKGLMFRESLAEGRGMLFVFEVEDFYPFWMKNCRFPIDIIWLSSDEKIVHIAPSVPPCEKDPCPSYGPMRKARYVLEVTSGTAAREGLALGDQLYFDVD